MRYLQVDNQTLTDLGIFSKSGQGSILDIYNRTKTRDGSKRLTALFETPISDVELINLRSDKGKFFSRLGLSFPFSTEAVDTFSSYLENKDPRTQLSLAKKALMDKVKDRIAAEKDYAFVNDGVHAAVRIFDQLNKFLEILQPLVIAGPFEPEYIRLRFILREVMSLSILDIDTLRSNFTRIQLKELHGLDVWLRFDRSELMFELLSLISEIDVYLSIAQLASTRQFHFSKALPAEAGVLKYQSVYHPAIDAAIGNDLEIGPDKNLVFLTGANMAGKSTLMKSLGITLFLAHIGLPVPAKAFTFSVCDGIYTSINLADNLFAGASHYYAEVLRLKDVAVELSRGKRLFVVFDELFRGTNVKDAYDGTLEVVKAFAAYQNCSFVISTHIIEAGEELQNMDLSIQYQYLPTVMNGEIPEYPRVLKEGITSDRQGMLIIRNEKILDLLDKGIELTVADMKRRREEKCLL